MKDLPEVDCAILAIAAKFCPSTVEVLAKQKNTKAFIILSAGFHEENEEGAKLERQIVETVNSVGGSLIGPNCIGVLTNHYSGVFTSPIPELNPQGVDLISGSGATALFIMDSGMQKGIKFNSMYSVGNSAQLGVEEILEYMDESFDPKTSSRVKLLYVESIEKPEKLLKHASSLIRKGCRIAAVKSGGSAAGSRAASSHTGALASSDVAVEALFRKAGIVRCNGRDELMTVAGIFMHPEMKGRNMAVVTHAGGPAVMLTDALSNGGMDVPHIEGEKAQDPFVGGGELPFVVLKIAEYRVHHGGDHLCDVLQGKHHQTVRFFVVSQVGHSHVFADKELIEISTEIVDDIEHELISRELEYFPDGGKPQSIF